jgi:hypothetical protein
MSEGKKNLKQQIIKMPLEQNKKKQNFALSKFIVK